MAQRYRPAKPLPVVDHTQFHGVRFFRDDDSLCEIVARFVGEGFLNGQPGVIVATPPHRQGVLDGLRDRGFDVSLLQRKGSLVLADAEALLATFIVDGLPDPMRFRESIVPPLTQAAATRPTVAVRVYGEMVNVLWQAGRSAAACRLEGLWNDLARTEPISLLCGYSMRNSYNDADIETICGHHSHVLTEEPARRLTVN